MLLRLLGVCFVLGEGGRQLVKGEEKEGKRHLVRGRMQERREVLHEQEHERGQVEGGGSGEIEVRFSLYVIVKSL